MPEILAGLAGGKASSERADPAIERGGTVGSATLRRQAMTLLNGISMGFGPVSMGADSGVWCRAVRSASLAQELCVPEDCR